MKLTTLYEILKTVNANKEIDYYSLQILTKYGLNTIQKYISYLEDFGFVDAVVVGNSFKWFITKEGLMYLKANKKLIDKI